MTTRRHPLLLAAAAALGLALAPASAPAAAAPAAAPLESTRGPGAGDCPEAGALAAVVNEGIGRAAVVPAETAARASASPSPALVAVAFARKATGYAATVRTGGARGGTRHLSDGGPGCGPLASAVGVLLVVLLDSDAENAAAPGGRAGVEVGVRAGVHAGASASAGSGAAPPARAPTTADLGLAGGVAQGLVGGWSPAVGVGGTLAYRRWAARLGGVWLPARANDYGPGRVEVGLGYARLALCAPLWPRDERPGWGLAACAQQQVGWMRGRGVDYDAASGTADHLWLAAGASVVASGPLGRTFGWEAEAGAARSFARHRFSVDNLGTAFQSDPLAFMTTFALTTRLW